MANPNDDPAKSEKVGQRVSIYKRGNKWHVNVQVGKRQIRKSLKTSSKKEARSRALAMERDIETGHYKPAKQPPLLSEVIKEYMDHLRAEGRAKKTLAKYTYCFDLLQTIAEARNVTRISQVDLSFVDRYRAARKARSNDEKPAEPKTIHNDTVTIRQLVNFALRRGMISEDPLSELKIKKPRRTPQPCWTLEQVEKILAAAKPPYAALLTLLADTGTRIGEAKWLTWEDIDFENLVVQIRPKAGWKLKSGDERGVPMSGRLREMFRQMPKTERWVFTARVTSRHSEPGRQISERRALQYLKRLLKRLGLRGHLHTFRHSFISFAAMRGTPERILRSWIGHVDQQTLAHYFHLSDPESQAAMRRLTEAKNADSNDQGTVSDSARFQHNEGDADHGDIAT